MNETIKAVVATAKQATKELRKMDADPTYISPMGDRDGLTLLRQAGLAYKAEDKLERHHARMDDERDRKIRDTSAGAYRRYRDSDQPRRSHRHSTFSDTSARRNDGPTYRTSDSNITDSLTDASNIAIGVALGSIIDL